ncbi:UNVERIFIED_CONTAM: hypothetical protein HDU68_004302, partial [Siphonaria sp. JEL0065]
APLLAFVAFACAGLWQNAGIDQLQPATFGVVVGPAALLLGRSLATSAPKQLLPVLLVVAAVNGYFVQTINVTIGSLLWQYAPSPLPTPAELLTGASIVLSLWGVSIMLISSNSTNPSTPATPPNKSIPPSSKVKKAGLDLSKLLLLTLPVVLSYYTTSMIPQYSRTLIAPPTAKNQRILEKVYSNTGHISIVEDLSLHGGIRVMRCDHSLLGGIFLSEGYHGDSVYGSFYFLGFVTGFERPSLQATEGKSLVKVAKQRKFKVVNIGLGIGIASKALLESHPNAHVDVIDLDPQILRLAVDHFAFPNVTSQTTFYATDGRKFLEEAADKSYDYVLHDVFTNGGVSGKLVSYEALKETRRILVDDGILALNFVGTMNSQSTASIVRTIKTIYPYVACFPEGPVNLTDPNGFYNMAIFASSNPLKFNPTQIPDPHAHRNPKKKTTSNGESLGHVRGTMLDQFPELRYDPVVEKIDLKTGDGGGVVLRDDGVVDSKIKSVLEEEEWTSRRAHWKSAGAYDFAWGFGGSAYQTEGAWNLDNKDVGIFDHWYHQPSRAELANADVASDQYHHYKEDLKLLPQLGATLYRFSISWPRVMNGCTASVNPLGIAFYNSMIDEIIKNGAVPFLTMYHWDMPQACFEQFQGFASDRIIPEFVKYADVLYESFGDRVKYWLTINEAESNCKFGFQQGRLAPGYVNNTYQATIDCVQRSHRLHAEVVSLAKTKYNSAAKGWKFGWPSNVEWNEPASDSDVDIAKAEARNLAYAGWYHDPLVFGDYQQDLITAFQGNSDNLDAVGRAPPAFSNADKAILKGSVDFIAMNYYSTSGLHPSQVDVASGAGCPAYCWQHAWGNGARKMANWYYKRYNMDIIVTELGFAVVGEADMTIDQIVNSPDRLKFWQTHATAVAQALEEDKLPIKGLLVWSLVDNFEWGYYDQRFGAVAVVGLGIPNGSLQRVVKNSTYWLADYYRSKKYSNPFVLPVAPGPAKDIILTITASKTTTTSHS